MEKIFIKNSRGQNLAADLYKVDPNKIIIMCHGFVYDRHEKDNKYDKIAEGFSKGGYSVLRFDFAGSGESDDGILTVANQEKDLRVVIKYVKSEGYKNIILFGGSLGGLTAFEAYDENIKAIIGLAPATYKADLSWRFKHFTSEQLSELENTGQTQIDAKGFFKANAIRTKVTIGEEYLEERENLDQEKLLKNIDCPVLIFHSNNDEYVPLAVSEKAVKIIGDKAELYFVKDAGHAFVDHIDVVIEKVLEWLKDKI